VVNIIISFVDSSAGGSLVSTKVVITASHCVQDKRDAVVRKADESWFHLGKYYLNSQPNERDYIVSAVSQFIVHSDWKPYEDSYDGDIAAAILTRTIQFTNFIRPICIWTTTHSYNDILNKNGVVVGYGKTEFSVTASDRPYWVELPVVDEGTCLRSNSVFSKITSHRTFCVGNRDGS
jgi:V8-like Glu-specific endopeptidase